MLAMNLLVLLLFGCLPVLAAQATPEDTLPMWEPPPEAAAKVRGMVASKWGVSPDELHLEWSRPHISVDGEKLDIAELLGSGKRGRWMVSFDRLDRDEERLSVPLRTGVTRVQSFAREPIARGEILGPDDMDFLPQVHWGPPMDLPPVAEEGWVAQRRINAGEVLTTPGVRPPLMVVSGRPVQLVWSSGQLKISLQGKAVGSAALGEQVFVRTDEGHRMAGIVTGPSTVLLSDPGRGGVR